ncbi:hypothetical protein PR048_029543 [Dryococelus australis]|uniref:Uncharacterized protein n=1 Tax=Dryococelus australis TaxID=614101 RepID=A0ABQ9GDP1_9NEOP|nr:hypothetical protein PR048_029543 [Dryococelus australis]
MKKHSGWKRGRCVLLRTQSPRTNVSGIIPYSRLSGRRFSPTSDWERVMPTPQTGSAKLRPVVGNNCYCAALRSLSPPSLILVSSLFNPPPPVFGAACLFRGRSFANFRETPVPAERSLTSRIAPRTRGESPGNTEPRWLGGLAARALASHRGKPGSIPVAPGFSHAGNRAGRCRWSAGFLEDLPFPAALAFRHYPDQLSSPSSRQRGQPTQHKFLYANNIGMKKERGQRDVEKTAILVGAAVDERFTPDFRKWITVLDDAAGLRVFPGGSPVPRAPLHSGAAPYSPHFALIGSQDLNNRLNLFTDSLATILARGWRGKGRQFRPSLHCYDSPDGLSYKQFEGYVDSRATSCGYNSSHPVWHALYECLQDIHGDSSPFLLQPFHELSNGFWPRLTSLHPAIQFVPKMFYRVEVGALDGPVQSANIVVGVPLHSSP